MTTVYIDPRKNLGIQIPIRVQVKMARDYCNEKGISFSLPKTESFIETASPVLEKWIKKNNSDIIVYSHLFFGREETIVSMQKELELDQTARNRVVHITYSNRRMSLRDVFEEMSSIKRYASCGMSIQKLLYYLNSKTQEDA